MAPEQGKEQSEGEVIREEASNSTGRPDCPELRVKEKATSHPSHMSQRRLKNNGKKDAVCHSVLDVFLFLI